jgi:hypothetical protein
LQCDKSLLTSEAVPVRKIAASDAHHRRRGPAAMICLTFISAV